MYKVAISVCLFLCPIITQESLDRFASNFDFRNYGRTSSMLLAWFCDSSLSGSTFIGNKAKIVIYDEGQVNGAA